MLWVKLTSAALAATTVVMAPLAAQAAPPAADSAAATPLSAEQLTRYIAVKQALGPYWQAPAHAALLQTAVATVHTPRLMFGGQQGSIGVFDYPSLVTKDAVLAAIFTKNALAASQFEPTQVAVYTALLALVLHEVTGTPVPAASTVLGKNVALVAAHRQELAGVGVALQVPGGMGGSMGSMDNGSGLKP